MKVGAGSENHEQRLAELLKALRKREKLSQEELGWRIGLHRNVVYRLERRPGQMRLVTLKRWCAVLREPMPKVLKFAENAPPLVNAEENPIKPR